MKLKDVREYYYGATDKLSEVNRQLDFAGIGIIWMLKVGDKAGGILYDHVLLIPLATFVGAIALDLLHYVYKSLAWGIFARGKEKQRLPADADFKASRTINWPTLIAFWGKVLLTIFSYMLLLKYLALKLLLQP